MPVWTLLVLAALGAEPAHFGAAFSTPQTLTAATLLADPAPYVGQVVRVEGRVADVCQKAGCWMVIADQDKSMRVLMKDHAFGVAKDSTGRTCQVEGTIEAKPVDPATVAHYASEAGSAQVIPEKQAGVTYQLVATGVELRP